MATCASCGAEAPAGARFCPSCGAVLAARSETRKVVTVLFCDWVGSTPLGEGLDAESLRRIQESFFAETRRVLERHGGTVEKFIGDAVMAVFGIPQAHEDDALRAARAAVELREALATLNERLRRELGIRLSVRTGVNTGEVIAGDPSAGQAFATGDAVVVAKRLEEAAAAGEILIGNTTRQLVRDAALVEPVERVALKGKDEPTHAWRLLGIVAEGPAFARRLDTELVGRERELGLLRQAFARAAAEGSGHLFTVLGPAGVGKSRLVAELLAEVGAGATVLRGRCLPYGEGITYWPLVVVVREAAQIERRLSAEDARSRIAATLAGEHDAEAIVEHVAAAIGLSDALTAPEETFWAFRRFLESLARRRPVVVAFDDVHWGEATFLDLVEYLGDWTRDAPILIVCLARPELLDSRTHWGGGKLNATSILLEPLSNEESSRLAHSLLGEGELAEDLARSIIHASEGNPLFIEETLAMLLDEGTLRRENGTWRAEDPSAIRVPPTIQALLASRLDRLTPGERRVIETAAVTGKLFLRSALAELTGDPDLDATLAELSRKELIRPVREGDGGPAFQFRHILIQDAAYRAIPKERRAGLHERFAVWLEQTSGERVREVEEIVGYHLEQAYRNRAELGPVEAELASRARSVLVAAGRRALARGDASAATSLLQRALTLPWTDEPRRVECSLDLVVALRESGDLARAEQVLHDAVEAASASADAGVEARALVERSYHHFFTDPKTWIEEALPTAEQAIPILEELGDDRGLSQAWSQVLLYHYSRCRIGEMEDALEKALEHAERAGDRGLIATTLKMKAQAALVGPLPVEAAIARCGEIAAQSRGSRSLEAVAVAVRACLEAMRGRFDDARRLSSESRDALAELGQVRLLGAFRSYSGYVELLAGDPAAAEEELRTGARALEAIGDRGNLETVTAELAQALLLQGRDGDAREYAERSRRMAPAGDLFTQVPWRLVLARLEAKAGRAGEAEQLAREAVALAEETDHPVMQGDALLCFGEVLLAAGAPEDAEGPIREAITRYEAKGNLVSAERARVALERIAVGA